MKAPAFQFYPGDFLSSPDVQIMEAHEIGAYLLLLCAAWQSEQAGHLANDEGRLRRLARLSVEQWRESARLLLSKFPLVEGTDLRANPRMLAEMAKQESFRQSRAEAGRVSAAKRAQGQQDVNKNLTRVESEPTRVEKKANKNPTLLSSSSTSIEQPLSDSALASSDVLGFDVFWNAYNKKTGPKKKIAAKWEALPAKTRELIVAGLPAYRLQKTGNGPQYMPDPQTFLNGANWQAETYGQVPDPADYAPKPATPDPETDRLRAFSDQPAAPPAAEWRGYHSGPNKPGAGVSEPLAAYTPTRSPHEAPLSCP